MSPSANPSLFAIWLIAIVLQVVLAVVAVLRIRTRYPIFTLYAVFTCAQDISLFCILALVGNRAHFYAYYGSGVISTILQIAVLVEIFSSLFRPYFTVPAKMLLVFAASTSAAVIAAAMIGQVLGHHNQFPLLGACRVFERVSTYAETALAVAIILFARYYSLPWRSRTLGICSGMTFQLSVALVVSTILPSLDRQASIAVGYVVVLSSIVTLSIWIYFTARAEALVAVVRPSELAQLKAVLEAFQLQLGALQSPDGAHATQGDVSRRG